MMGVGINKIGTTDRTVVSVTSTSAEGLAESFDRRCMIIQNVGGKDCWMRFGAAAVKEADLFLAKKGGNLIFGSDAMFMDSLEFVTKGGNDTTTVIVIVGT